MIQIRFCYEKSFTFFKQEKELDDLQNHFSSDTVWFQMEGMGLLQEEAGRQGQHEFMKSLAHNARAFVLYPEGNHERGTI